MAEESAVVVDVRQVPFSTRGSWLDLSPVVGLDEHAADVHVVSHKHGMHAVLRCVVTGLDAGPAPAAVVGTADRLRWSADSGGTVSAAFEDERTIRFTGAGLGLRFEDPSEVLTPFTGTYLYEELSGDARAAVFTSYETGRRYRVVCLSGELELHGQGALGRAHRAVAVRAASPGTPWEVALQELDASAPPFTSPLSFEQVCDRQAEAFREYLQGVAGWRTEEVPAAALAAYVLWSATVSPDGFLRREAVLMSKHWMDKVWSWDHCFTALALVPADVGLALDQFLLPFDHQDSAGALPDSVAHSEVLYNFVKPPVHGWAFRRLRAAAPRALTVDELTTVYDALARWTRFWLDHRRPAGRALPHYQHGNDSGWDNSTVFDGDRLQQSPDLAAFLVVQLGVLAELADELVTGDGAGWRDELGRVRTALLRDHWEGDRFVSRDVRHGVAAGTTSLLTHLALVACDHLPPEVSAALADRVREHLTERGLATELLTSPRYEPDGYWRGPVWAPPTVLLEDGLRRSGQVELADQVAERFLRLCERSGFAENFDAVTGEGLRDRAYTWTAGVYLCLAREAVGRTRDTAGRGSTVRGTGSP